MDFPLNFFLEYAGSPNSALPSELEGQEEPAPEPPKEPLGTFSEDPMMFFRDLAPSKTTSIHENHDLIVPGSTLAADLAQYTSKPFEIDFGRKMEPLEDTYLQPSAQMPDSILEGNGIWSESFNDQFVEGFPWDDPQVAANTEKDLVSLIDTSPFELPNSDNVWLTSEESLLFSDKDNLADNNIPINIDTLANIETLSNKVPHAEQEANVDSGIDFEKVLSMVLTINNSLQLEPQSFTFQGITSTFPDNPTRQPDVLLTGNMQGIESQNFWQYLTPGSSNPPVNSKPSSAIMLQVEAEASARTRLKRKHIPSKYDSEKPDRRKAKPIASRFREFGSVSVTPSCVQCLNVVLDYHGFTGTIRLVILNDAITNVAVQPHDVNHQRKSVIKELAEEYVVKGYESLYGHSPGGSEVEGRNLSVVAGILQRKIHVREIHSIVNSVGLIAYVKSGKFNVNNPYEPQYYRYELDDKGRVVNESKCGMCAFCPLVKFLPFKNSSYLSHMTLEHGIFASNYVVPEGLYYGRYRMLRSNDPLKTRTVKALQCPACFKVIEVACWKNKSNPLLSYFRHFKKVHLNLNKTFTSSTIDPVLLKHQGGDAFQEN